MALFNLVYCKTTGNIAKEHYRKNKCYFSGSLQETGAGCQGEISKAALVSEMLWEHGAAEEQRITVI